MSTKITLLGLVLALISSSSFASVATAGPAAPELSASALLSGLTLIVGGILMFADWKNGKTK